VREGCLAGAGVGRGANKAEVVELAPMKDSRRKLYLFLLEALGVVVLEVAA